MKGCAVSLMALARILASPPEPAIAIRIVMLFRCLGAI